MLDAARTAIEFTRSLRLEQFLMDRKTRNTVERNLEIIGEAARHVSEETRDSLPDIPWRSMIAFRNVLTYEYGEVRYEVLRAIVRDKLRPLIRPLEDMGVDSPPPTQEA